MKGISRRAATCAVAAATSALALTGTAFAQDYPAFTGDGVNTGQGSIQLFTHSGYISSGSGLGTAPPELNVTPAAADGSSCATSTSTECRWNRLDALFGYFAANGLDSVELFGHAGLPTNENIEGPYGWKQYRELLDKHGLHAAGWHGSMNETAWPARVAAAKVIGLDYIGSGGVADPGIGSYDAVLRSAAALNRLGKYSVENGVGPAYIHNHTGEFDAKYVENGELKTAFDILMERTDPRYVAAQVDAFWATDAFNDPTGEATAALINKWGSRVKLMHVKDGINTTTQPSPTNSRGGSPRAFGTGEVDYRPILAAGKNRVQYYSQEQDGANLTDMVTSLRNLKGRNSAVMGTPQMLPTTFDPVPVGTATTENFKAIKVTNVGDATLSISRVDLASLTSLTGNNASAHPARLVREDETPAQFQVLNNTCVGNVAPGASCAVTVGYRPVRTNASSIARLVLTSSADDATESVLLMGQSNDKALGSVGGTVASMLSLTVGTGTSFGAFTPALARDYFATAGASVVSTAGDAMLSVTDATNTAPGHLVNGTYSLPQALYVRATNGANPSTSYQPLSETSGEPVELLTYAGPTSGADPVTLGFRQSIGASDALRAGAYSKTLTYTLSTQQP